MLVGTLYFQGKEWEIIESRAVGTRGFHVTARAICETWEKDYPRMFFITPEGKIKS